MYSSWSHHSGGYLKDFWPFVCLWNVLDWSYAVIFFLSLKIIFAMKHGFSPYSCIHLYSCKDLWYFLFLFQFLFLFCFVFSFVWLQSCSALYIQAIFTFPNYFDSSFLWYSMEIVVAVQSLNCALLFVTLKNWGKHWTHFVFILIVVVLP